MTVTAVVVSHDNEPGLRFILNNLLGQTRRPDEIVALCSDTDLDQIRDDYPDATFRACENRNDWGHEKRAQGLALATSEWVGFFNDDDSYADDYLEVMLERAATDDADVVYCAWNEQPGCRFVAYQSTAGNFLCRTQLAQTVGWTGRSYTADGAFIDALGATGAKVTRVDQVLYHHNVQLDTPKGGGSMKRYRVSGSHHVAGNAPGDVFEASYTEEHELYLLEGGHLELVQADPPDGGDADAGDTGDTHTRRSRKSANSRKE